MIMSVIIWTAVGTHDTSDGLIKGIAEAGADLSEVASDTVAGVIRGAKSLGMQADDVAIAVHAASGRPPSWTW